jgi:hypothetical protein
MKFNPFRPHNLAPPELFRGRDEELNTIERCLFQAKNGNPSDNWVNRIMIKKEVEIKDTTLNNALQALKNQKYHYPK